MKYLYNLLSYTLHPYMNPTWTLIFAEFCLKCQIKYQDSRPVELWDYWLSIRFNQYRDNIHVCHVTDTAACTRPRVARAGGSSTTARPPSTCTWRWGPATNTSCLLFVICQPSVLCWSVLNIKSLSRVKSKLVKSVILDRFSFIEKVFV